MCGHAEALVAHDRHVRPRRVGALHVAGLDAEAGVLEEVVEPRGPDARRGVDEVAVHLQLVVGVRRARSRGREGAELGSVDQPVLPGRQDVAKAPPVVGLVGGHLTPSRELQDAAELGLGRGGEGARGDGGRGEGHGTNPSRPSSPDRSQGAREPTTGRARPRHPLAQASAGTAPAAIASISPAARSNSSSDSTGVPSNGRSRCSSIHERQPWYSGRTFTVTGRGMR